MRILYLNSNYKGEGTFNRCFRIARQLVKHDVEITILTVTDKHPSYRVKQRQQDGVRLIELPAISRRRDYLGYLIRPLIASWIAKGEKIDIVHIVLASKCGRHDAPVLYLNPQLCKRVY